MTIIQPVINVKFEGTGTMSYISHYTINRRIFIVSDYHLLLLLLQSTTVDTVDHCWYQSFVFLVWSRWFKGSWSPCTRSCGSGARTREVHCFIEVYPGAREIVDESSCSGYKPLSTSSCMEEECPPEWETSDWTRVSVKGRRTEPHLSSWMEQIRWL